ncbi:MAG: hypothetical protein HUK20_11770 [Fibrobacter sp.]|nr:hypothetical protein [Fibrobacter sp.]
MQVDLQEVRTILHLVAAKLCDLVDEEETIQRLKVNDCDYKAWADDIAEKRQLLDAVYRKLDNPLQKVLNSSK